MKLLGLLLITAYGFEKGSKQESNKFLSRERRANDFIGWEERKDGDYKRECFDEVRVKNQYDNENGIFKDCSKEENLEVTDDPAKHRQSWAKLTACKEMLQAAGEDNAKNRKNCYENEKRQLPDPKI